MQITPFHNQSISRNKRPKNSHLPLKQTSSMLLGHYAVYNQLHANANGPRLGKHVAQFCEKKGKIFKKIASTRFDA